jgi:hypothetical protein
VSSTHAVCLECPESIVALIKLLAGPLRRVAGFPLVQLIAAIAAVLWLQAAESRSIPGEIFTALDRLVDATVRLLAATFELKSFTRSWLTTGFMIGYVYIAGYLIVLAARMAINAAVELAARRNAFGLTNAIARERGIAAYRAWLPLERIRPAQVAQAKWEERFAWPADGTPPYPPWWQRTARAAVLYAAMVLIVAALLQAFTPFPALSWLGRLVM